MTGLRRDARRNRRRILKLYRKGHDVPQIAQRLKLHHTTVNRHLQLAEVNRKLEAQRAAPIWQWVVPRKPYWELQTRMGTSEIMCGRKFCSTCGHWRHISDFGRDEGRPLAKCQRCVLISRRYHNAHITPEQRARRNEYLRIWKNAKQHENGKPLRIVQHAKPDDSEPAHITYLPVEPLRLALIQWEARTEHDTGAGESAWPALAELAGVSDRSIRRIRHENRRVDMDIADRLALAIGTTLSLLYHPDDETRHAA